MSKDISAQMLKENMYFLKNEEIVMHIPKDNS